MNNNKKTNPFFYCLGQGFLSVGRNKVFSLASIATVAACVFMIGIFMATVLNVNYIVDAAEDSVCITVFFDEGLSEADIQAIGSEIETWQEISTVSFTSADEAWESFKEEYFKDSPELAEGFADDNPLANSASYEVYLNSIEDQTAICERIEAMEGVRQVNRSEVTAGALTDIGRIVGIVSIILIAVLLAVSIFLIANTIITGITVRKEEIQIMKYVGATDFFVKSPFVFEGIVIGIIGAIIPLIILFFGYKSAISYVMGQLQTLTSVFSFMSVLEVFKVVGPLSLIIGAGIGFIGSMIATGKHIKV